METTRSPHVEYDPRRRSRYLFLGITTAILAAFGAVYVAAV